MKAHKVKITYFLSILFYLFTYTIRSIHSQNAPNGQFFTQEDDQEVKAISQGFIEDKIIPFALSESHFLSPLSPSFFSPHFFFPSFDFLDLGEEQFSGPDLAMNESFFISEPESLPKQSGSDYSQSYQFWNSIDTMLYEITKSLNHFANFITGSLESTHPEIQVSKDESKSECLITLDVSNVSDSSTVKISVDTNNMIEVTYFDQAKDYDIIQDFHSDVLQNFSPLHYKSNLRGSANKVLEYESNNQTSSNSSTQNLDISELSSSNATDLPDADLDTSVSMFISEPISMSMKTYQLPNWCDTSSLSGKATVTEDETTLLIKFPLAENDSKDVHTEDTTLSQIGSFKSTTYKAIAPQKSQDSAENKDEVTMNSENTSIPAIQSEALTLEDAKKTESLKKREIPVVSYEEF